MILASAEALSKKPPLQNLRFKWWECVTIQTILDPERFAIGGGISAQPVFINYIQNNLNKLYAECPYHVPHAEVVSCKFQNDANLVGALQCYLASAR